MYGAHSYFLNHMNTYIRMYVCTVVDSVLKIDSLCKGRPVRTVIIAHLVKCSVHYV